MGRKIFTRLEWTLKERGLILVLSLLMGGLRGRI